MRVSCLCLKALLINWYSRTLLMMILNLRKIQIFMEFEFLAVCSYHGFKNFLILTFLPSMLFSSSLIVQSSLSSLLTLYWALLCLRLLCFGFEHKKETVCWSKKKLKISTLHYFLPLLRLWKWLYTKSAKQWNNLIGTSQSYFSRKLSFEFCPSICGNVSSAEAKVLQRNFFRSQKFSPHNSTSPSTTLYFK